MGKFIKIEFNEVESLSESKITFISEGLSNIEIIGALRYYEKEMFVRMCQINNPLPKKDIE